MMAVLSRVPHCRPQLLPVELGTDMQHGQSMSAPPAECHGGASSTLVAALMEQESDRSVWVMYGYHLGLALAIAWKTILFFSIFFTFAQNVHLFHFA